MIIDVELYLLSEAEGGRRNPIYSGYRPQLHFSGQDKHIICQVLFENPDGLQLGIYHNVQIEYFKDIIPNEKIITLFEGTRKIGVGKIIK